MPDGNVCFLDTETTSLHPETGEIWNVGLIYPVVVVHPRDEPDTVEWVEKEWFLPVDLSQADPMSLAMNHFRERYPSPPKRTSLPEFSQEFMRLTWGQHIVGAIPSFDTERLWRLLNNNWCVGMWHYHVVDVEALAIGFLRGSGITQIAANPEWVDNGKPPDVVDLKPPWRSKALSIAMGVNPDAFEQHTALGDARWAKAIYEKIFN